MEKRNKISSKMYKHLRNKKCNKKCATFMWYFLESDLCLTRGIFSYIEDINFTFPMYKDNKTQRKGNFFINLTMQKAVHFVVHFVVQFCALL